MTDLAYNVVHLTTPTNRAGAVANHGHVRCRIRHDASPAPVGAPCRQDGCSLALAGCLHLVRLGRWAGDRTWRERLVLILHVGYAFVPIEFLLNAAF
jgi:hypothetical protein